MSALTRCVCTITTFIHLIYVNQNQVAQAVTVVHNGTLGKACYPNSAIENCKRLHVFILQHSQADYCLTHWVKQNLLIFFIYFHLKICTNPYSYVTLEIIY